MMLFESISEIGLTIQGDLRGQMSWSMSWPNDKRLSSQQLLDLPNPNVCLVLI